jgi:hypothetical protein
MYRVDITADLNDADETGYAWTFLDEARDPGQIKPGAIVTAGNQESPAVCQVVGLAPAGDGTIVHLRILPGWSTTTAPSRSGHSPPSRRRPGPGQPRGPAGSRRASKSGTSSRCLYGS